MNRVSKERLRAFGLGGQVALVTGSSSGIGRACAVALGAAGCTVIANHRPGDERCEEVMADIERAGGRPHHFGADVSDEDQVESMFDDAVEQFGAIDILVNNAGMQDGASFAEMSLDQWKKVIEVNLTGQFLCARAAVRRFLKQGVRKDVSCAAGKIICMSSVHEVIPWACEVNYAASKGGISLLMKSLAQEVADRAIRVNALAPGAIKTAINTEAWESDEARDKLLELIPYGRIGEAEDIALAAVWLASDLSDYVTGASIVVDGGMQLYPGFRGGG